MSMSEARAALEGATPPPAPPGIRGPAKADQDLGVVAGVGGDEVIVVASTDRREDARVCLITSWDAEAELAATVVLTQRGVDQLVDLLEAFSAHEPGACVEHLIIDCEECAGEDAGAGVDDYPGLPGF